MEKKIAIVGDLREGVFAGLAFLTIIKDKADDIIIVDDVSKLPDELKPKPPMPFKIQTVLDDIGFDNRGVIPDKYLPKHKAGKTNKKL